MIGFPVNRVWHPEVLLVLLLGLGASLACSQSSPTQMPEASPVLPDLAATESALVYLPQLYADPTTCVAVSCPPGWYAEPGGYMAIVDLYSYDPRTVPGTETFAPGMTRITILLDQDAEGASLDERVSSLRDRLQSEGDGVVVEDWWDLEGGTAAWRGVVYSQYGGGTYTSQLLARIDGVDLYLIGFGDLRPFDAIARTLRHSCPGE